MMCFPASSIGTVKDVQLAGASTDQMALVEYATPSEALNALNLNGMKIGDTHTLQVGSLTPAFVLLRLHVMSPVMSVLHRTHRAVSCLGPPAASKATCVRVLRSRDETDCAHAILHACDAHLAAVVP